MTAGTNGSTATVSSKEAIKVGTSSKGGDMSITVGAGATKLTLYAAAWKGVTGLSLNITGATVSPASISLTADDGISNNSPFTLKGTESNFKFEITLSNITEETTITFTSSTTKRFVVWGASYETSGSGSQEPTLSLDPTSVSVGASDVTQQTIALTASNFSPAVTTITTGLYSNEGCTSAVTSGAWVKDITVNNAKTQVTFNVDNNTGAARQVWLKITASNGTKSADAILPISQAKYTEPTGTFNKFTGELVEGDYILYYPTNSSAMKNTVTSNRLDYSEVNPNDQDKFVNPDESIIWHLAKSGDNWTIYNAAVSKYAGGTTTKNQGALLDNTNNNLALWTCSSTSTSNTYDFLNVGRAGGSSDTGNKYLRNNKSGNPAVNYGFACYASGTGGALTLYRKLVVSAVTKADVTGGTLNITGAANLSSVEGGTKLTVTATPTGTYIGGTVTVTKTVGGDDVTAAVYSNGTITMPEYAITVSASFTPTYAITGASVVGGSFSWEDENDNVDPAYVAAGVYVQASANATAGYVFSGTYDIYQTGASSTKVDHTDGLFEMPAHAVTIGGSFNVAPSIILSQTETMVFAKVATGAPVSNTFTINAANLTAGSLNVTKSGANPDKFNLSASSITVTAGAVTDAEVTVTPITTATGDYTATITVDDGEGGAAAQSFNVTLHVEDQYTAKWWVNGVEQTAYRVTEFAGADLTFPDAPTPTGNCAGTEFMGWLTAPLDEASADEPEGLIKTYTGHTMPAAAVNYYAVFAEETPGAPTTDTWELTSSDINKLGSGTSYSAYDGERTKSGVTFTTSNVMVGTGGNAGKIQLKANAGIIYNNTQMPGDIVSIAVSGVDLAVYQGTEEISSTPGSVAITKADGVYPFSSGKRYFHMKKASDNAGYTSSITVTYNTVGDPTYNNYVTTCVACSNVSLVEAGETNGTITLKQGSKAVSSVKTCNGAVTLTTNAVAETGYELTNIALSGVANATVNQEMTEITIPANATGELTVTATFSQKNYEVALAQSPATGATLDGATTTAHYNATINISTTVPDGYLFAGWTPANLFANAEAANAVSTSFTMPNNDVTVTANFTQIYTVADALALVPEAGDNSDYVYVGGLISYVDETSWDEDYKNINYYISANGTRENELLVYHGYKGYNKETFDAITDIKAGDKVIVYGKLTNYQGTKEFAQNNKSGVYSYIYQFTEAILSSVEVGGTLTKTDYFINDDFTREGLTATAVYSNTGYSKDITDEATWTNNLAGGKVTEDGTVRVTATYNTVPGYKDVEVTVTTKVLESIELSETALTGYLGQAVQKPATVTAHFDDNGVKTTENVTAFASFDDSDYDATSTAEQTITVSYQFGNAPAQTADYTITLSSIRNTIGTAYTVEKGRSIIDLDNLAENNLELDDEGNKVFVQGYITDITSNKYTIKDNIEDTEFIEIYEGTLGDGISSVKVGDLIKVEGNLYFYENNSHTVQKHQILNGEIVAVVRTPNLTVADVAEMEVNFTADLAEADLTINKDGSNGDITFACTDPAVTIVNNKLHAAEAGDATVTATIAADGIYSAATTTFNVHVIAERTRYAITMDANGGSGTDPEYAKQLEGATVDLPATCPYTKANSAFDAWVVTETISGNAVTITDGHFTMPAAAVTIKATWNDVETCHISFQVSGGEVATAEAPQTVAYSLAEVAHPTVDGFTFLGWSETEYADETTTLPTMIESYTPALNESNKTLYGIYSQVVGGENQHYVLDYTTDVADASIAYSTEVDITATDGSEWVVCASKQTGMQINTGKVAYIKVPDCPANIIQIVLTCNSGAQKAVAFSETSDGDALVSSPYDGTSQTLNFSEVNVSAGYIIPSAGNCQITHIDVEYSGSTTYYTSSPITRYNVTYAKGDATGVTGLCEAQRHAAGTITLCGIPTCADKNFAKWSDGSSLYNAGAEYTLSADVTFTATWTPKPTYSVTYNTSGSTGTTPVDENEYLEGAEVTLASASGLSNAGYVFNGWSDGSQVYAAGYAEYAMPDHDVTFTATWAEISSEKWVLVTHEDALEIDGEYAIVSTFEDNYHVMQYFALGEIVTMNTNKAGKGEAVTRSGNIVRGSTDMVTFTLKEGSASGKYAFKNGDNYLTWSSGNTLENDDEVNDHSSWAITIGNEDDIATIANVADNTRKLQYNSSSPRFACYTSAQKAVQLFKKAKNTVVEDATETKTSAEVAGGDITVGNNGNLTINVSVDKQAEDLTVKNGGKLTLSGDKTLKVNNVYLSATMASGKSSQMSGALAQLDIQGEVYFDITLGANGTNQQWHAFTVPFPVDVMSGIYDKEDNKLTNEVNYAIMEYHGDERAKGNYGWKKIRTTLVPGTFYIMATDGYRTTYRFKKKAGAALVAANSKPIYEYPLNGGTEADKDNGWNGLGNPNLFYGKVDLAVQVLDPESYTYVTKTANSTNFVVGTPFFYQAAAAGTMVMETADAGANYAPARVQANEIKDVPVSFGNEDFTDYLYISANEDALNEYETGKDLVKMTMTNAPKVAQIFGSAYGNKLCMVHAPMVDDKASYALSLYAPADGTYHIETPTESEDATLYLTKDGRVMWNLSMSACELELSKGTTENYGLLLVRKTPGVATGMENVQSDNVQCTKVIIDNQVFILRGGQMYDLTGKKIEN